MQNKKFNHNHEKEDKKILTYNPVEYRSRSPIPTYQQSTNNTPYLPRTFVENRRNYYARLEKLDNDFSQGPRGTSSFGSFWTWFVSFICIYFICKILGL